MGWIATKNESTLAKEAREAADREEPVFVTVLHSKSGGGSTDGALQVRLEWAKRIAAIEAEGWRLEHWSVGDGPTAYPVFRRLM